MNISGKMKIFKNEINGRNYYSTSLANKLQDGSYEYMKIDVQFPKDITVENKSDIEVTKGFMSFYKDKNGIAKPKAVIQEWNNIENSDETVESLNLPF